MMKVLLLMMVSGSDFPDHIAVGNTPIFGIAFPAVQRFAIEDVLEAGLLTGKRLRPVALFRRIGLTGRYTSE